MSGGNMKKREAGSAGITPAAKTTTSNGSSVDLSGYNSALVVLTVGTITDGTHTPKLQECDDNSTWADVAAGDLEGTFAALASSTSQYIGYKGHKRYLRVVVTVTGSPSTGGVYGAAVIKGQAQQA